MRNGMRDGIKGALWAIYFAFGILGLYLIIQAATR